MRDSTMSCLVSAGAACDGALQPSVQPGEISLVPATDSVQQTAAEFTGSTTLPVSSADAAGVTDRQSTGHFTSGRCRTVLSGLSRMLSVRGVLSARMLSARVAALILVVVVSQLSMDSLSAQRNAPVVLEDITGQAAPRAPESQASFGAVSGVLAVYSLLIVTASLLGGWLPSVVRLTHTRMQTAISFVGGLMLGIGVLHLLPAAFGELRDIHAVSVWMMTGIAFMFALLRMFHFHNHEPISPTAPPHTPGCSHSSEAASASDEPHEADSADVGLAMCEHPEGDEHLSVEGSAAVRPAGHAHGAAAPPDSCDHQHNGSRLSWLGIAAGLSLHSLAEGLSLGVSVARDARAGTGALPLFGLATFAAIVLHKPLDAVSVTTLMMAGRSRKGLRNLVNIGFALMCPVGAALTLVGIQSVSGVGRELIGSALAFSAGVFLCISLSDLLPEMEFHSHNKGRLTAALAGGIILAWAIHLVEH